MILFVYIIANYWGGGGEVLENDDGVKIPLVSAQPVGNSYK